MATFQAVELNKNNKFQSKETGIKRDVKIMIENATIYVTLDETTSLKVIIKELSNAEPRINR